MISRAWLRVGTVVLALVGLPGAVLPSRAQAPAPAPQEDSSAILAVRVNGLARGEFFVHRDASGQWWLRRQDLPALGLKPEAHATRLIDGEAHVALHDLRGVQARVDESRLTLDLTADVSLLERTLLDARAPARVHERADSHSAFLNWAVEQEFTGTGLGASGGPALSTELGLRRGPLLLLTQGNTVTTADGGRRFARLMSTAHYDLPQSLQRWSFGDVITRFQDLADGINLGGIALGKQYSLDPYLVRYPLGSVQGQATLPSDVEVYVDGQRVRSERVRPGEFEIRDLLTAQGARSVQVLVRDPYGRVQAFDYALYTSDQLLRPGLQEYQYAFGGLRRQYGTAQSDYGAPVFAAFHRWGLGESLTAGVNAQAQPGLVHGGPAATARLGGLGLLHAAVSASRATGLQGQAQSLRYDYQALRWGVSAAWRHDSAGHANVGEQPVLSNRKDDRFLALSQRLGPQGTLSLSRWVQAVRSPAQISVPAGFATNFFNARSATTLGYAMAVPGRAGLLRLSLSRLSDGWGPRTELNIGLTVLLDGPRALAASTRMAGGSQSQSLQWSQPLPAGEGWGYDLSAQRDAGTGQALSWRGLAQLNASTVRLRGDYSGDHDGSGTRDRLRLAASGSLALVDGQVLRGRPIDDAFALVKVGELPGVAVTVNGTRIGVTDTHGQVFVPQVGSNYETEFGIDARTLPIEQTVPHLQRRLVLPPRGGAVVDFAPVRLQALVGRLLVNTPTGWQPLPRALLRLSHEGREVQGETGLQGEFYLENLPLGRHHGRAQADGLRCEFTLEMPTRSEVLVEAGDIQCLVPSNGQVASVPTTPWADAGEARNATQANRETDAAVAAVVRDQNRSPGPR